MKVDGGGGAVVVIVVFGKERKEKKKNNKGGEEGIIHSLVLVMMHCSWCEKIKKRTTPSRCC